MTNNHENISIPFIKDLNEENLDELIRTIEGKGIRQTIDCLDWEKQYPYHPLTTVSLIHTADKLYIDFFVRSNYLRAVNYQHNSPVYEDSSVGVYLQPSLDKPDYFALMFNCIGTINASYGTPGNKEQLGLDFINKIYVYASCGNRPFQELEGLFSWNVIVGIPLKEMGIEYSGDPITVKGNFYKCASGTAQPHFISWRPIDTPTPDFDVPDSFGNIILL
ncbi:MAG: carbohydrate-binding family 9-like protein [Lachnospiraceae bacterium]|nr:carbohydrate-binding family 9-like protein [Lachnospiraceae bacterium]